MLHLKIILQIENSDSNLPYLGDYNPCHSKFYEMEMKRYKDIQEKIKKLQEEHFGKSNTHQQ